MDRFIPVGGLGPKVGEGDGGTYIVSGASLQAEIARLTAERDEWKDEYQTVNRLLSLYKDAAINRQAERDQALAQAASAATDMRKRAAATYAMYSGVDLTKRLLSLPIDPDAQKALDKMLARARGNAIREAEESLLDADQTLMLLGDKGWRNRHDAILALLNDGGRDE